MVARDDADADRAGPGAWPRPVPLIGDRTSAVERAADPAAWSLGPEVTAALHQVIRSRRDVRRYRADPVPDEVLQSVLRAGHAAPSVGHSQPWRFIVVSDDGIRQRAALMADKERLAQAEQLSPEAGRHLLDLQLEGIREAPLGVVVCCDRRTPAAGVLGRATFIDADLWSCACAIENMWLTARAEGLGMGWVTLFQPEDLAALLGLPEGVVTLGWLCLGWPDERPPAPGLERAGWSERLALEEVVIPDRWPAPASAPAPPPSRVAAPPPAAVVAARDSGDALLTPPGSLGVLDRAVDRVVALGRAGDDSGTLAFAAGRHLVTALGVTAFDPEVTDVVLDAARAGEAVGCRAAARAGLEVAVFDCGTSSGDLVHVDALTVGRRDELLAWGRDVGADMGRSGIVALGEVGVGNTTPAAALAAALLDLDPAGLVGRGAGGDSAVMQRKREVVTAALSRLAGRSEPLYLLGALGGPEFAFLTGVALGAAGAGAVVVLDGLATSVCALAAVRLEPFLASHLVAGQRSREPGHGPVLAALGLEPLLDLRLSCGEGAGAALACGLLFDALAVRQTAARTVGPAAGA
ncbi:MAG TPA: 5,6-dimethylbenzimidazole synthase [Acidimicrobiales bacterium]|nr:5,6-dimethylbenzimidazole synthase [Acidimicrobiales bacterium]